ncbi:MAG: aldehyde ferredoxin oxidoreductase family protein [Sulfolobales archaeon]|nr:aldehyde ferredoxin oxidoreductase family protein [Sulfolobales archaeon]
MFGWRGRLLRINLSSKKVTTTAIDSEVLQKFLGGRGLAAYLLWKELEPGTPPLSPSNKLIISSGPLTGLPLPSSGKLVAASKSPLTGGYGDGNVGTKAAVHLRKCGYDALIIEGSAEKPTLILVEDDKVELVNADHLWGLTAWETELRIGKEYGSDMSVLSIGPAGENLVKFSTIISEFGRSGGRPGIGAVMGSKKVKAIAIRGTKDVPIHSPNEFKNAVEEAYEHIKRDANYEFWIRQGTMSTILWANENSCLPTRNFREGIFEEASKISGDAMELIKVRQKGCPYCEIPCGNIVRYGVNGTSNESELDYENVAMLGSNIGLGDLHKVSDLNLMADLYGLDTISLGNVLAFTAELSEGGLIDERVEWGDYRKFKELIEDITYRRGLGDVLAEGVRYASSKIGGNSANFAMHVKGLEISAYDCHAAPGMALAYSTSPIGAHHKDAWFIATEIKLGRLQYSKEKIERLVWMQNVRGGLFESLTTCRFPWLETSLSLDAYLKFLKLATGVNYSWDDIHLIANRIYTLIRTFWIREYLADGIKWSSSMDMPPKRWFEEPLSKGPLAGNKLSIDGYRKMLSWYYEMRGWDEDGIPKKSTIIKLGLSDITPKLDIYASLKE